MNTDSINTIHHQTKIEGTINIANYTRFDGVLKGTLRAEPNTLVIIDKNGSIEGNIFADKIIINGFIRGKINAQTSVEISETGRVIGSIDCKSIKVAFGAFFEGDCKTLSIKTSEQASL